MISDKKKKYRRRNNFPTGYFENPVGISKHLQELYFPYEFISDMKFSCIKLRFPI